MNRNTGRAVALAAFWIGTGGCVLIFSMPFVGGASTQLLILAGVLGLIGFALGLLSLGRQPAIAAYALVAGGLALGLAALIAWGISDEPPDSGSPKARAPALSSAATAGDLRDLSPRRPAGTRMGTVGVEPTRGSPLSGV